MTDALGSPIAPSGPIDRPPVSGPGSGRAEWVAYAIQETGENEKSFEGLTRDDIRMLLDHKSGKADVREAPEGVDVLGAETTDDGRERAPEITDRAGRPVWAVPVEGGYVSEDELRTAERERQAADLAERHRRAVEQLRQRG